MRMLKLFLLLVLMASWIPSWHTTLTNSEGEISEEEESEELAA
jgi:hypothetical protein